MKIPIKQLHSAQMKILYELRHAETARYRDILRASGLENDGFRFHLNTLSKYGYIEKDTMGYTLTAAGKEFANNLDRTARMPLKQPKLSIMLIVTREIAGTTQYLFQQRQRQPYYGFWGNISGPVIGGEELETTAAAELYKQTGLRGECRVWSFCRQKDLIGGRVQEDKQFIILHCQNPKGDLQNWHAGISVWMTAEELRMQPLFFANTLAMAMMPVGIYQSQNAEYDKREY